MRLVYTRYKKVDAGPVYTKLKTIQMCPVYTIIKIKTGQLYTRERNNLLYANK